MQRILIDHARKKRAKRGGGRMRSELPDVTDPGPDDRLTLALDEALTRLAAEDPAAARRGRAATVRRAVGHAAVAAFGVSRATVYRGWTYARAWLREANGVGGADSENP